MTKAKEETPKTHYLTLLPTNHIRVADIPVGKDVTLTIKATGHEEFYVAKAKEYQRKGVVKFVEGKADKFLILNKTRADQIAGLHGDYLEDWIGKQITIYVVDVKVGKKMEPAIRVREPNPSGVDLLESTLDEDLSQLESNGEDDLKFDEKVPWANDLVILVLNNTNLTETREAVDLLDAMNCDPYEKAELDICLGHYSNGINKEVKDPVKYMNAEFQKGLTEAMGSG